MNNLNANKVNNVKGSKKAVPMIIAAIVAIAGAATLLTGCGTDRSYHFSSDNRDCNFCKECQG